MQKYSIKIEKGELNYFQILFQSFLAYFLLIVGIERDYRDSYVLIIDARTGDTVKKFSYYSDYMRANAKLNLLEQDLANLRIEDFEEKYEISAH